MLVACQSAPRPSGPRAEKHEPTTVLFVGDTHFGDNYFSPEARGRWPVALHGYDYPLSAGLGALTAAADLVVANLETPLVGQGSSPLEGRKSHLHWTLPAQAAATLARHGVGAVSLANNHAMDFGEVGLQQTLAQLRASKIDAFGAGSNVHRAARPLVRFFGEGSRRVQLVVFGAYWYRQRYDRNYGFYARADKAGVWELRLEQLREQIRQLEKRTPHRWVVVFPHWGSNYQLRTAEQRALARSMIDAGADMVIGHGAHVFQRLERYRKRWIVYGLGNFVFLSQGRYDEHDIHPTSMSAALRLSFSAIGVLQTELQLRFIASDNTQSGYRPTLLRGDDFQEAASTLARHSCSAQRCYGWQKQLDRLGPLLSLHSSRSTR